MLRILSVVAVLALVVSASSAWVVGEGWVELINYGQITSGPDAGKYEYIYDVHNDVDSYARRFDMLFDATGVVNQFAYYDLDSDGIPDANCLTQSWSSNAAGVPRIFLGGWIDPERWPSYWEDTNGDFIRDSWVLPTTGANVEWAMDNIWHEGGDYDIVNGLHTWEKGYVDDQGVHWLNQQTVLMPGLAAPGLMFTFRLVHPMPKGDDNIVWSIYQNFYTGQPYYGTVDGPIPEPATMSLLALGACLPLFRRKRR